MVSEVYLSCEFSIDTQDFQYMIKVIWVWKWVIEDNDIVDGFEDKINGDLVLLNSDNPTSLLEIVNKAKTDILEQSDGDIKT